VITAVLVLILVRQLGREARGRRRYASMWLIAALLVLFTAQLTARFLLL
jgi:hypothetical protein